MGEFMTINSSTVCFILVVTRGFRVHRAQQHFASIFQHIMRVHTHKHTHTAMSLVCQGYHQGQSCAPTSALRPSLFFIFPWQSEQLPKESYSISFNLISSFLPHLYTSLHTPQAYTHHKHTHITSIPHINKSYT